MDFTDVLSGRCSLSEAVAPHPTQPNLYLLTAPTHISGVAVDEAAFRRLTGRFKQPHLIAFDAAAGNVVGHFPDEGPQAVIVPLQ